MNPICRILGHRLPQPPVVDDVELSHVDACSRCGVRAEWIVDGWVQVPG